MAHPYTEFEGTRLWTTVESAINDLAHNVDLVESTARPSVVGYLCQRLLNERQVVKEGCTIRSETITSKNLAGVEWDEGYFKFCNFEGLSIEGGLVSSDFHGCTFKEIDWYWGLFSDCNLIDCNFVDCTFAGTNFPGTKFINCKLVNCKFIQDNLGVECGFSETSSCGCSVENSSGFIPHSSANMPTA